MSTVALWIEQYELNNYELNKYELNKEVGVRVKQVLNPKREVI